MSDEEATIFKKELFVGDVIADVHISSIESEVQVVHRLAHEMDIVCGARIKKQLGDADSDDSNDLINAGGLSADDSITGVDLLKGMVAYCQMADKYHYSKRYRPDCGLRLESIPYEDRDK